MIVRFLKDANGTPKGSLLSFDKISRKENLVWLGNQQRAYKLGEEVQIISEQMIVTSLHSVKRMQEEIDRLKLERSRATALLFRAYHLAAVGKSPLSAEIADYLKIAD